MALSRVTARLSERQGRSEEVHEAVTELLKQGGSKEAGGSKAGGGKLKLKNGDSAGTLGLLKRWEDDGPRKFKKWVKEQGWFQAQEVEGYGDEGRRLNDFV